MSDIRQFTVRPLTKQPRSDLKDAFRVHLSPSTLASLRLQPGDLCALQSDRGIPKAAIAWSAFENIQNSVVQTSRTLQDCYGIKLGDKLSITKVDDHLDDVSVVSVEECTDVEKIHQIGLLSDDDKKHWEWALEHPLSRCEVVCVGLTFDVELKGQRRSFRIEEINAQHLATSKTIFRFVRSSSVRIDSLEGTREDEGSLQVRLSDLGGLSDQVKKINECLTDFDITRSDISMPQFYQPNRGILIYGPKGTGKTALLRAIAAAGWKSAFTISSSTLGLRNEKGEEKLRQVFQDALRSQPSVITIDQVEVIAPKRTSAYDFPATLVHVLSESLDNLKNAKVLVVAAGRHPNEVDDLLRTPHRLAIEIELSVPTAQDRLHILRAIRSDGIEPGDGLLEWLAEITHGYVGADLFALLQRSCHKARHRLTKENQERLSLTSKPDPTTFLNQMAEDEISSQSMTFCEDDFVEAMREIRPTAMREVFLETPKVKWSDIGGQHSIKQYLQRVVERPLKFPDRLKKLNLQSKKGVLLYGPPGCSKTLTVKALAAEAGLNFLAVKGAEVLSMYVGESERALREIFQKARAARPSIIFFDEIDAIATKRNATSQSGVNLLTTLLNEMDGIEELKSVLVIAATNKPEVLDPALMRPGRLDNILYIGPPDFEARQEILKIWFTKSDIDDEVDVHKLAVSTEGYSGAEIVSICETAGEAALDEEEETQLYQRIAWRHFEKALGQVRKQITRSMIQEYEDWSRASLR